jgi:chorismate mutase
LPITPSSGKDDDVLRCRGIRGATVARENTPEAILDATRELLELIVQANEVQVEDITSAFFTLSDGLDAAYPALAARQIGWDAVALLCARELPVPGGLDRVVRVLLHVNTEKPLEAMRHIYLREAIALRPSRAFESAIAAGMVGGEQ